MFLHLKYRKIAASSYQFENIQNTATFKIFGYNWGG
jgi:hypothetical protein